MQKKYLPLRILFLYAQPKRYRFIFVNAGYLQLFILITVPIYYEFLKVDPVGNSPTLCVVEKQIWFILLYERVLA
jgi:hypothetical protein